MDANNNNLQEVVEALAELEGITEYKSKLDAGSMKGDNYMGIITCIEIDGTGNDGN